ncbi:MAG: hypothetical protein AB7F50_03125 [Fimbriimonadaceae bacterium]
MLTTIVFTFAAFGTGASGGQQDDQPRMAAAEREFLLGRDLSIRDSLGLTLQEIEQPCAERTDVLGAWTLDSRHWMSRVFRREVLPDPSDISWSGSTLTNRMGTWEHVNAVFRLAGKRAWWADGFTNEDPRATNPFWLWIELDGGELDTSSREGIEATVATFVERVFTKYDESALITAKVWSEATEDNFGYWSLIVGQDVPDRVPSPCGWMKSMGVDTNGRHMFVTVLMCTDSTFKWNKGTEYFPAANMGYRRRSRFTGEPIKYAPELTTPGYIGRGGS